MGEVGKTFTGLSGKTKEDFGHGNAYFVTYMNVYSNPISNSNMVENVEIDTKQQEVKKGDVFFTTSSETPEEVGMSSVWLDDKPNTYLNSFCFGFRPMRNIFNFYYLAYLLRSNNIRNKMIILAQGISRYNISKNKVMELEVAIPKIKEQQKIGEFFKQLDSLITLQQRKLKQLKQLKTAMLQQLFVSKNSKQPVLRFENFDSDWRQHSLEDISAKIYSGLTGKSKDDFGHGKARYITYLNVHNNEVAVSDGVEQIEVDSKQNKVLKGDLLFTISSEVPSEVALNSVWSSEAGTDIYLNSFCFGIRPKSNYVNSFFLTYYLRSPQMRKLIYPLAQGISRFNISKRSILALKINTPVLPE
ncbi:restriction endonuclease subunit S [Limosilactobacillus agrestis]|nr:restriction endonuclease subunit S [Limosilactobacillus agrestis]